MSYTKTDWIEGVTPVNPTNLNKIEQGIEDSFKSENVNMLPTGHFLPSEPPTSYPMGISTMRVAQIDGWPANGTLVTFRAGNNTDHFYAHQKLFQTGDISSEDTLIRYGYQTTWLDWDTVWNSRNASVIIEEGSNSNGRYVRWSDGLQICYIDKNLVGDGSNFYRVVSQSLPASFVGNSRNLSVGSAYNNHDGSSTGGTPRMSVYASDNTYTTSAYFIDSNGVPNTAVVYFNVMVIGRWK